MGDREDTLKIIGDVNDKTSHVPSPSASGIRAIAELVLGVYGVNSQITTFLPITLSESAEAVKLGQVDAALFLQPQSNKGIKALALRSAAHRKGRGAAGQGGGEIVKVSKPLIELQARSSR